MASYLLDADAVIDYLARTPASLSLLEALNQRGDRLFTCAAALAEVFSGVARDEVTGVERELDIFTFLETTGLAAKQAGQWRYAYARQGRQLATTDMLIAATAYVNGATVVTGNLRDFPMPEVSLLPLPR